jgi:hypothetical protein
LATLREVQAVEHMEFTADTSSVAAAAAAAAAPVEVDIDWGDLVVVDDAPAAAADAVACAANGGGDACDIDIDWNMVSAVEGSAAGGGEISWDIDLGGGEDVVADFAVSGGDDYGISISTDGVSGQVNVFEDPDRCAICVTRHTSHVTRHTSHVTRHTSLIDLFSSSLGVLSSWLTSSVQHPLFFSFNTLFILFSIRAPRLHHHAHPRIRKRRQLFHA